MIPAAPAKCPQTQALTEGYLTARLLDQTPPTPRADMTANASRRRSEGLRPHPEPQRTQATGFLANKTVRLIPARPTGRAVSDADAENARLTPARPTP